MFKGTYEICIDNESSYTTKIVYLWIDYQQQNSWDDAVSEDTVVRQYQLKQDFVRVSTIILHVCIYVCVYVYGGLNSREYGKPE